MKNVLSKLAAIAAAVIMIGCGSISNPLSISPKGEMAMSFSIESPDVASGTVTITKDAETVTKPVSFIGSEATVKFNDIDIGRWTVSIELRDAASAVLYSGSAEADVTESAVTTVTIDVPTGKGSLRIAINAPRVPIFWNTLDNESALAESMYGNPLTPFTVGYVSGFYDGAARFYKAQGSYASVQLWSESAKVFGRDEVTIEFWYKFIDGQSSMPMMLSANFASTTIYLAYTSGYLYSYCGINYSQTPYAMDNDWHHIALVIYKGKFETYIDGVLFAAADLYATAAMPHIFYLGAYSAAPTTRDYCFNGVIDNIKVWNFAKTDFSDRFKE